MDYENKTDEELRRLAMEISTGAVFCDMHCHSPEDVTSSFMIIMLCDEEVKQGLRDLPVGLIYEYMSEAGPMSVNGRPSFMSMKVLNVEEAEKVKVYIKELEEFTKGEKRTGTQVRDT